MLISSTSENVPSPVRATIAAEATVATICATNLA
jgi:hypothetical protein